MIELPPLYSKDAKGQVMVWQVRTSDDVVIFEHGKMGGKMAVNRTRCQPTNVGRSNERLGPAQAEFEAQAAWDKKVKMGHRETIEAAKNDLILLPTLAMPRMVRRVNNGLKHEEPRPLTFPLDVQLKYNGLRGLAHCTIPGSVRVISRSNTAWEGITRIRDELALFLEKDEIADGEVYGHGIPLQTINSLVKVEQAGTEALHFRLYDLPSTGGTLSFDATWAERKPLMEAYYLSYLLKKLAERPGPEAEQLMAWVQQTGTQAVDAALKYPFALINEIHHQMTAELYQFIDSLAIQMAPTWEVQSEAEITPLSQMAIAMGYEGLIMRQREYPYALCKRTNALVKWKQFQDGEFEILDARPLEWFEGTASFNIIDVFVVRNDVNDATFEVKPRGSIPEKRKMWEDRARIIGKMLQVRFPERSIDDVPQGNPVGIAIRLDEDMPEEADDLAMWD